MSGRPRSRDADHFERLYSGSPDPWQFRTSAYEHAKYRRTLAALGDHRFRNGFEVGCSVGVLTHLLAARCDALLAVDIVAAPLPAAREICRDQPHVRFARMHVPREWPHAAFDLIVLSEVLYFLAPSEVAEVANLASASIAPNGLVLLVNWRGCSGDPCTGDEAADIFIAQSEPRLRRELHHAEPQYRIDLLRQC